MSETFKAIVVNQTEKDFTRKINSSDSKYINGVFGC